MFAPRIRWSFLALSGFLVLFFVGSVQAQNVQVRNVEAYQQGKNVVIEYDLIGDRRVTYDVDLRLSRDGGETYDYAPSATSGAIGSGISPGDGKEIVWAVLQDFPEGIDGDDYQFKVRADQEGTTPTRQRREPAAEREPREPQRDPSPSRPGWFAKNFRARIGVGLAYNTRETIQLQFYDGYQFTASIQPRGASLSFRMNYRITTGAFSQPSALDFDLLYNGGFYYLGSSVGLFRFGGESVKSNINVVAGIGTQLGGIYPYVEYRFPFSRNLRDDALGWGILYTF